MAATRSIRLCAGGAVLAVVASVGGSACSDDAQGTSTSGDPGGTGAGSQTAGVTFHKDVEPILQQNCLVCHRAGQIGGFSLEKYESAKALSTAIVEKTESGEMPPFLARETAECDETRPWLHDKRLSAEALATLRAWHDAGAPEGNPADAPPAYVAPDLGLPNKDTSIVPATPSTVEGETDQFICVIYDPALSADTYVDGLHFIPQNPKVAHHALVFRANRQDALSQSGGGERYTCFGGPPGDLVHGWVPGSQPLELPAGVGIPAGPDDVFVVQMHYHPTGTTVETDASALELRYTDAMPQYAYQVVLIGAPGAMDVLLPGPNDTNGPEFRIPPNAVGHTEEILWSVPNVGLSEVKMLSIANHMHYVGVDQRVWLDRAQGGGEECLLHTPSWDFNWQMFYQWDVPLDDLPVTKPGDVWNIRCEYDNSMGNPFVVKALAEQGLSAPKEVTLGEQTLDEMCLVGVGVLIPAALL